MKKLLLAICFAFLLAGCNNYSEPDAMVNETIKTNLSQKDFVMVHAGVAIAKITEDDAAEADEVMEDLL